MHCISLCECPPTLVRGLQLPRHLAAAKIHGEMLGSFALLNFRLIRACMTVFSVSILLAAAVCAQVAQPVSLRGRVRDEHGSAVVGASVELQSKDSKLILTVHTDRQGGYQFSVLHDGVYALRVAKNGYAEAELPSVFLAPKENKTVDLTLEPVKTAVSQSASTAPQFFDQPQFTVAGVTDTTSLGGHGSNTMALTRDTIAKETVSLSKPAPNPSAASVGRETSLRETLGRDPSDFVANHQLGQLLIDNGRANEAIPYFERAAAANPADFTNAYDLALANAEAGHYKTACDHARTLLALHDTAELHHLLGDVEEKLGDSLEAVHQYQRAVELEPTESYLFDWGSELLLHHAPEPALEVFNRGHQLFPRSARMLIGTGAAWFARGSYDQAIREICQASDLNPDDSIPYLFLGRMLDAKTTPSAEAVEKLQRFVTLQPQNAKANYYYAVALWKTRTSSRDAVVASRVETLLNNSVRLDPGFAAAHLQLGILRSDKGDDPGAILEYQQAVRIDPQMEEAHYRLAQAYRQNGDTDKAKEELHLYGQLAKASNQQLERERHEIKQFVYTLRDPAAPQAP
jgi:tetratricopeptide (TPR) repeat protein